jgi:RhtB (resistance to homoserine/threonine) family protein
MIDANVWTFTVLAAALTLTPGADTMLVLRNVLRGNRRTGFSTTLGVCTGLFGHALLSGLGLSVLLLHSAELFSLVKLAGAAYLIRLGYLSLRDAARQSAPVLLETTADLRKSALRCFREGLLTNLLNPKVAVFYLAFLPQFIGPSDPVMAKSILLAGIHYVMGIAWLMTVSVFVDQARRFITRTSVKRFLDGLCGAIMVGLGLKLIMEKS